MLAPLVPNPPNEDCVVAGWPNAGAAVVLPNKPPPVVVPAGFVLNNEVDVLLPNTGVAPLPKPVVVEMGLPKLVWPKGLLCVAVLNPPVSAFSNLKIEKEKYEFI